MYFVLILIISTIVHCHGEELSKEEKRSYNFSGKIAISCAKGRYKLKSKPVTVTLTCPDAIDIREAQSGRWTKQITTNADGTFAFQASGLRELWCDKLIFKATCPNGATKETLATVRNLDWDDVDLGRIVVGKKEDDIVYDDFENDYGEGMPRPNPDQSNPDAIRVFAPPPKRT